MPVDSPLAGLLLSLFAGGLGIQGFVVNPANPDYKGLAVHQRRLSIAIIALLVLVIIMATITVATTAKGAEEDTTNDGEGKGNHLDDLKDAGALGIATMTTYGAYFICIVASFIIAVMLLMRKQ